MDAAHGAITICQDCGFAIQFRQGASAVNGDYEYWAHFRLPMTPHIARPVRCWSEHDYYL